MFCTTINQLSVQLKEHLSPFCEESFRDESSVFCHTGLAIFKVLKVIFDHVFKTLPVECASKLTSF